MQEWWSASELLALGHPSLPNSLRAIQLLAVERRWNEDKNRCREIRGNGGTRREYRYNLFPPEVQNTILVDAMIDEVAAQERDERSELISESLWLRFSQAPGTCQNEAKRRVSIVQQISKLRETQKEGVAMG